MLKTEQPMPQPRVIDRHPERIAWLVLLTAFGVFCVLATSGGSLAYRWWTAPDIGVLTAQVDQELAVQVQRAGLVKLEVLNDGELRPGDRVLVDAEAAPGPATTLRFGSAAIALWAGTDVYIGSFGAQWNDPAAATARLRMASGQMLIEIAENDQRLEIEISQRAQPIVLQGQGRYRIRVMEAGSPTTAAAEQTNSRGLEVATERGLALLGSVEVRPGQRLVEALNTQTPRRNQWNLVRDGNFQQLVDTFYNRQDMSQLPWKRNVQLTAEGAADTGQVRPEQDCIDPIARTDCNAAYIRLVRMGGNDKGFSTAIEQSINADVTSYQRVKLRAQIKVVSQSLSKAGESGTECPLLIRVMYGNTSGDNLQKDYCFWAYEYPGRNGVVSNLPYIETKQLVPDTWYAFDKDLKQDIPDLVSIQQVSFQANGHDYESQVSAVQLTADGLAEVPTR